MIEEMGREEDNKQEQVGAAPRAIARSVQEQAVSQADVGVLPLVIPSAEYAAVEKSLLGSSFVC